MYTYKNRIRYSEIDKNGKLSLISLLNYFQDCSTFHSEDLGLGYQYLIKQDLLWVLSAWQIVVFRYPELCENIIVGTAPYEFRSVIGYRNFLMTTEESEQLACANSIWTLLDTKKGRPAKPTAEMINGYQLAEKLPMDYADRKIAVPGDGTMLSPIEVKPHHLDTNNHVNNGQYISIAMDLLADSNVTAEISQLRAEYRKSAVLGDIMYPKLIKAANTEIISLQDTDGNPYCVAEMTRRI
ncbi:MAG: thioesterase [Lachnospiraceae bacterium]|nr:thioesterase [Lachnospiraceae bacterium]